IRDWMGRFDGIPNVAKRMARMGQCFSSTEQAVLVRKHEVRMVPDMEGGAHPVSRKPYVFSDGVGMMSVPLAQEVYKVMKLKERPSAIQIRYAGAKGMLCINPELPNQKLLYLRPSMQKFPCTSSDYLEVVKVSAPRKLHTPLGRVHYLDSDRTIHQVSGEYHLEELGLGCIKDDAIMSRMVSTAMAVLTKPRYIISSCDIMVSCSCTMFNLVVVLHAAGLRYKTRIALPVDRARNMLGVVDTTGVLRYGQVFVQCSEMGARASQQGPPKCRVITGQVLVTKCPCLHPGDVRKFTAIDEPRLHHVVDCIVFPGQGHRPHPDEMAGSDLDGDEYIVIWEPSLLFPGYNKQPMNFSDRNPEPERGEITINDMIQFLCNYIKNDSIGILSNAHLAWADQEEEGIYSRRCLAIAEKISICLDFAKSGRTAYLRREERPMFYPDFMEKGSHKISYRSDRVLGLLYRTCRSLEAAVGSLGHRHVDAGRCLALDVPGWQRYESAALAALADYNTRLRRILNQYGIAS
ncbi:RNA-directed RNA polymerase, putative, partial [Ixodes scapularis]